jgi:hypothetical protein
MSARFPAQVSRLSGRIVWQLDRDLEFDRHEVVAADLLRASRGDERLDRRQAFVAAERFACRTKYRRRVGRRGLSLDCGNSHKGQRNYQKCAWASENPHVRV